MTNEAVFIGIELAGGRSITYAVLNARLQIEKKGVLPLDDLVEAILTYPLAVCAVNAPIGPSRGLLSDPNIRERLGLDPELATFTQHRVCEYELKRRGLNIYNTPSDPLTAPHWMQVGWQLYNRLRRAGYVEYPRSGTRRMLETYPPAAFATFAGRRPYSKRSVEGRLQRQIILDEAGVKVPNAMNFLEEWTRHRIMTGQLNVDRTDQLFAPNTLDALIAAYTAYLVENEPLRTIAIGDVLEGQIVLPAGELKDSY